MSEKKNKELSGLQRLVLGLAVSTAAGVMVGYECFSEDEKKETHKVIANRMFDRATSGKLKKPYDDWEKDYIKEGLKLE